MRNKIFKSLNGNYSYNGVAVNGTPYTQWKVTDDFFDLWKKHKEEIKSNSFSLYKDKERGWVVTLFGEQIGTYTSYTKYLDQIQKDNLEIHKNNLIKVLTELYDLVDEYEARQRFKSRSNADELRDEIDELLTLADKRGKTKEFVRQAENFLNYEAPGWEDMI